ncbi:MAG TPA: energy transducer TonB [Chryseobacterium sp.]
MKKFIFIISFISNGIIFGQVTSSPAVPQIEKEDSNAPVDVNKIYENPDQMPAFPEGILAFRTKFGKAIILDSVQPENGENDFKGMISFAIERDGSMTDLKVAGSNESFNAAVKKAVKSIKDKWKPAIYKGEIVRSRFRIPLTISKS